MEKAGNAEKLEKLAEHKISEGKRVHTGYESIFKEALLSESVPAFYELIAFPLHTGSVSKKDEKFYVPDFITGLFINGKEVIIEPHFSMLINLNYMKKLKAVREEFNFYIIFASDKPEEEINTGKGLCIRGFVDDFWYIEEQLGEEAWAQQRIEATKHIQTLKKSCEMKSEEELTIYLFSKVEEIERINLIKGARRMKQLNGYGTL
ncbi:MAG: hypothetical protein ACP5RF_02475 [Candidatus Micrarchaeia archaeon]